MGKTAAAQVHEVTGDLVEIGTDTIVLGLRGTDYRLHLVVDGPVTAPLNKPITGRITARAQRVDIVGRAGRYIEPMYGRPRRLQGTAAGWMRGPAQYTRSSLRRGLHVHLQPHCLTSQHRTSGLELWSPRTSNRARSS